VLEAGGLNDGEIPFVPGATSSICPTDFAHGMASRADGKEILVIVTMCIETVAKGKQHEHEIPRLENVCGETARTLRKSVCKKVRTRLRKGEMKV